MKMIKNDQQSLPKRLLMDNFKKVFKVPDAAVIDNAFAIIKEKGASIDPTALKAADLLLGLEADAVTIASTLLAPLIWERLISPSEIKKCLGKAAFDTLNNLKFPTLSQIDEGKYRREDIHALLASMSGIPRRAVILITFRFLALEDATDQNDSDACFMAKETLDLYVPIANRLGLSVLRRRLEDSCFRIQDPSGYNALNQKISLIQAEDDKCLQILLGGLQRLLKNNGIRARLQGRKKNLYSINRKMVRKGKSLEEIMDRIGIRIILRSVPKCYIVLGLLHTHFKTIRKSLDDYIGFPKENGYQSLHTCVYPVREISHKPIEFQIRTEE
jgi:GTP pyrophosphokinase